MTRLRILLADDHRLVAECLAGQLQSEFDIVGIVGDGHALVKAAMQLKPDVIVTDIAMPLLSGIEAIEQLRKFGSRAVVVLLTMHTDAAYLRRGLAAGASGFVLKHSALSELVTAIHLAVEGRTYVTPLIAEESANSS